MKTCFLVEPGCIELREIPIPKATDGEMVIKVKVALTCGTDLKAYRRGHPKMPMPTLFGHEFSGEIIDVGFRVNGYEEGEPVMVVHTAPCGACYYCRRGLENLCADTMHNMVLGAYSEYIKIPRHIVRNNIFNKPENLSYEEAAILEPLACVVHGIDPLPIKPDDTVLIIGAGAIGLLHVLLAKVKGALNIIVAGKHQNRLQLAKELGANYVVDVKKENSVEALMALTRGFGANWVFECTGRPLVWEQSVSMVSKGGTVVLFGGCPTGTRVTFDTSRLHYDEITLVGAFHFTPRDVEKAFQLLAQGQINVRKLITDSFPLKDLAKAFDLLIKGDGVKFAIVPNLLF
ncbi:MAG: zinc-binding dehydrogenase [bacterium]